MEIQNDKPTVEVCITEAGGFGDVSAGINLASSLSRDYNILVTFASSEAEKKYMQITKNNRLNFRLGKALAENDAIARVLPFIDSRVISLLKKPTIVVSQYNGESYLYGRADFSVVTGLGIEELCAEKDGRYMKIKPEEAVRSGLYIKEMDLEEKISRLDICSELNKVLSEETGLPPEHIAEAYKKMAGKSLEDSGWITSYSGELGINGIIYDALAEAVSKSDTLAKKSPVVLNFINNAAFMGDTVPVCKRNGFNTIYVDRCDLKVTDRKSPVTVINFGFVDDELYEQAVKKADLMNVSAGDGSFSKAFSAFLKTETPFLKYYNHDQRWFTKGLVDILHDIEACEGSSHVTSDFFETFTAHELIYKACANSIADEGKLSKVAAIKCRKNLPIENVSRLFYDEKARHEFYKVASQIPEKIRQRREEEGIEKAEVLPNAFDTTRYIIAQLSQGKTREQILTALTGREFKEPAEEDEEHTKNHSSWLRNIISKVLGTSYFL